MPLKGSRSLQEEKAAHSVAAEPLPFPTAEEEVQAELWEGEEGLRVDTDLNPSWTKSPSPTLDPDSLPQAGRAAHPPSLSSQTTHWQI